MKEQWAIFLLAVQFLTRLPVPASAGFTPERLAAATRYYPLAGALIGGFAALAYGLALMLWPPAIAVLISMAATIALTGAFHEDGLADTFDGIGGGLTRERALEIMKDSRIGTYGAVALILTLALKAASLAYLPAGLAMAALVAAHGLSRFSSVVVIATSHYVRQAGTGKPTSERMSTESLAIAAATGLLCVGLLLWAAGPMAVLAGLAGLALGHLVLRLVFERKLGGYSGDALGAVQQASEIGLYLGLLAWL